MILIFKRKLYRQPIYYNCRNYAYDQCMYNNNSHNTTNIKLKLNFNFFNHALTTITICNISLLHSVIQRHSMLYYHTMTSRHIINQYIIIYNSNSPAYKRSIAAERLLLCYICIYHIVSHNVQSNNESFVQYYIL